MEATSLATLALWNAIVKPPEPQRDNPASASAIAIMLYGADLDLFGRGGLFELLSEGTLALGVDQIEEFENDNILFRLQAATRLPHSATGLALMRSIGVDV